MAGNLNGGEDSSSDSSDGGVPSAVTTRSKALKTPQTPKTPKTPRKPSYTTSATTPKIPKTPKTLNKGAPNRVAKTPITKTPRTPRTPKSNGPKTLKTVIDEAGQSGLNDDNQPQSSNGAEDSEPKQLETPKDTPLPRFKDKPTRLLESLPEIPDDGQYLLCGRPDAFWMNNGKSKLTKETMEERLTYYVRPRDSRHVLAKKKKSKTKIDLLIGLKQVYYERPQERRWTDRDLMAGTGTSGQEYQEACMDDGSMPPTTPEIIKKAPKRPTKKPARTVREPSKEPEQPVIEIERPTLEAGDATIEASPSDERNKPTVEVPQPTAADGPTKDQNRTIAGRPSPLDERSRRFVEDAIQNALIALSYHRLNRHPQAFSREPVQANAIMEKGGFQKVIPAAFSANSDIHLQFIENFGGFEPWSPHWRIGNRDHPTPVISYPIRGRGPVWSQNSCAIDACIVAGTLLEAGSLIADREGDENWVDHLSEQEYAFLKVLEKNWSIMTREQSCAERNDFWNIFNQVERRKISKSPLSPEDATALAERWQIGNMQPLTTIWDACTASYGQFRFRHFSRVDSCTQCGYERSTKSSGYVTENYIMPDYSNDIRNDATISELMGHYFSHVASCRGCKAWTATKNRIVIGHLPARLVVFPNRNNAITEHTNNVRFSYLSVNAKQWDQQVRSQPTYTEPKQLPNQYDLRKAEYRWLGGIYCHKNHFRVYWVDNDRHKPDDGYFKAYDGMCAEGAIVGNLESAHPTERVHPDWVRPGSQVILFYEKVLSPTGGVLQAAAETISKAQAGAYMTSRTTTAILQSSSSTPKDLSRHFVEGSIFNPILIADGNVMPPLQLTPKRQKGDMAADSGSPAVHTNEGENILLNGATVDPVGRVPDKLAGSSDVTSRTREFRGAPSDLAHFPPRGWNSPTRTQIGPHDYPGEVYAEPRTPPDGAPRTPVSTEADPSNEHHYAMGALQASPASSDLEFQAALLQNAQENQGRGSFGRQISPTVSDPDLQAAIMQSFEKKDQRNAVAVQGVGMIRVGPSDPSLPEEGRIEIVPSNMPTDVSTDTLVDNPTNPSAENPARLGAEDFTIKTLGQFDFIKVQIDGNPSASHNLRFTCPIIVQSENRAEPQPDFVGNSWRFTAPVVIKPADIYPPDYHNPEITHDPEPTLEEMFPEPHLIQDQPRDRQAPAEDTCFECGGAVSDNTSHLTFIDDNDNILNVHDDCFRCPRCHSKLHESHGQAALDRDEIAIWGGPVKQYDGEVLCKSCGSYLDGLEKNAPKRVKRKSQGEDEEHESKKQRVGPAPGSRWTPINLPRTMEERGLKDAVLEAEAKKTAAKEKREQKKRENEEQAKADKEQEEGQDQETSEEPEDDTKKEEKEDDRGDKKNDKKEDHDRGDGKGDPKGGSASGAMDGKTSSGKDANGKKDSSEHKDDNKKDDGKANGKEKGSAGKKNSQKQDSTAVSTKSQPDTPKKGPQSGKSRQSSERTGLARGSTPPEESPFHDIVRSDPADNPLLGPIKWNKPKSRRENKPSAPTQRDREGSSSPGTIETALRGLDATGFVPYDAEAAERERKRRDDSLFGNCVDGVVDLTKCSSDASNEVKKNSTDAIIDLTQSASDGSNELKRKQSLDSLFGDECEDEIELPSAKKVKEVLEPDDFYSLTRFSHG